MEKHRVATSSGILAGFSGDICAGSIILKSASANLSGFSQLEEKKEKEHILCLL